MCMWDQPPHKWDVCLFNITLLLVGLLATNDSLSYLIKKILRIFFNRSNTYVSNTWLHVGLKY